MGNSQSLNIVKSLIFFTISIVLAAPATALKPSHEADRLLLAAEQAFADNNWRRAEESLQDALQLGISLPADYNFLYGKLLVHKNKPRDAQRYLEQYVNQTGRDGHYYREALSLITDVKKQSKPTSSSSSISSANRGKAEIRRADNGQSYVDHIQTLYGTGDAAAALTQHINNLLKFYAYGDPRILASSRAGKPSRHKIQFSNRGEIISFNKVGAEDQPFKEDRFSVYGVNHHISYQCRASTSNCWLYHPITSQKWLQIVANEDAALEISKAMSQLIRSLQKAT